jgi:hypothetical protein
LEQIMAISRLEIESIKKGRALRRALYIERVAYYGDTEKREELKYVTHANMPEWCKDDPMKFWHAADQYERSNAAAGREVLLTLPRELTFDQNVALTDAWAQQELVGKPHHCAIHEKNGDCHAHVLYSDRLLDEHERQPEQFFRRYNAAAPQLGGAKKDSGGKSPIGVRVAFTEMKGRWDELQSQARAAAVGSFADRVQ